MKPKQRARPAKPAAFTLHADPTLPEHRWRFWDRAGWGLGAAVLVVLLTVALGPHKVGDYFTETDFYGAYAEGARGIQHGRIEPGRYAVVGPVYEMTLALVGLPIRDLLLAAELLSVASAVAALLLWQRLLARRADPRLAFAASLFIAVNTAFLRYGFSATTDALSLALQAAAMFLLLTRTSGRAAFAAGAVAALAYLTRYNAVVLLPAGVVAALAGGTLHANRRGAAALFAAGFLAPVLPWMAFSITAGGSFSFQLHHNIAYDVFARARGITWDDYQKTLQPQFPTLWSVIARDPGAVMARELFNVWDHLRLDARMLLGWPAAIAALAGLLLGVLDGTLRRLWPLWLTGTLLFLSLVPAFYSERYSLTLLPIYAALAGAAFASPRFALAIPRARIWLKAALIGVPLVFGAAATRRSLAYVLEQLPVELLESARALRTMAEPGDRIMARKPHLAFHAGLDPVPFPFAKSLDELAEQARAARARWLFFSWPEAEMRPDFWHLIDTSGAVPGLRVRHASPRRPAVLYEIGPGFGQRPAWFDNDTLRVLHQARARLMVNPRDITSLMNLALIERGRGRLDSARQRMELAARLAPRDARVWLALGEVSLALQDPAGARAAYERVASLAPNEPRAQIGLGWASFLARDVRGAAAMWRPAIGVTSDPGTLGRMIEVFAAVGDAEAEAQARAALARQSRTP